MLIALSLALGLALGSLVTYLLVAKRLAQGTAALMMVDEQRRSHATALAELKDSFRILSADALKQTHPEFLRLAQETFSRLHDAARGDLSGRQEAIAKLVQPLGEQLLRYQERLQHAETQQARSLGEVHKQLELLSLHSGSLVGETAQLRRVLSSNQARGRWGEETLRRVVEAAGLSPHCDFTEQSQQDDKKPDLIVRLPNKRFIIVDAKVPDLEGLAAAEQADASRKNELYALHAQKLRGTIKALADRDYPHAFKGSLDYVVMFLPAESLFSSALEADQDLIVWAAEKRIILATPSSLIAILRSVSVSWREHAQSENAREIAQAARELFNRVSTFVGHLEKIRGGLERANSAYNDAVGSYERSVRPSGERLATLGSTEAKEVPRLEPVQSQLRLIN